ncbi:tail fiber assembly protein [Orbus wheelerorum]|uniref:tail fiber assembly protein n=1 Tax=Orbus wheelerorum TaxID=3074111 RepID=UPI00370D35BC
MKYQIKPIEAIFNDKGFSQNAGYVTLYNFDNVTYEFIATTIRQLPAGISIPADSCLDAPNYIDENTAIVRDVKNNQWIYPPDHRGKQIYNIHDGSPKTVDFIGELPDTYTDKVPGSAFDSWNGKEWIEDKEKALKNRIDLAKQEQESRLSEADSYIYDLNEAIELELATDAQKELHKSWRQYRFVVKQININQPDSINWPAKPQQPNFISE